MATWLRNKRSMCPTDSAIMRLIGRMIWKIRNPSTSDWRRNKRPKWAPTGTNCDQKKDFRARYPILRRGDRLFQWSHFTIRFCDHILHFVLVITFRFFCEEEPCDWKYVDIQETIEDDGLVETYSTETAGEQKNTSPPNGLGCLSNGLHTKKTSIRVTSR